MDRLSPEKRAALAIKRLFAILVNRARRVVGRMLQVVLHDEIGDLSRQTQRLGSASVESVTYLGGELRALDERLTRIENELAALRGLLERSESPDDVVSGPRSG
jgi:hypothetical protein